VVLIDVAAESFDRMFFAIAFTRIIPTKFHLSSGGDAVTGGKRATRPRENTASPQQ
jgi:hypothetical protein